VVAVKLQNSLRTGRAGDLAAMFNENVDLLIDSEGVHFDNISQNHAELILKSFFKRKPATDFNFIYQGSGGSSRYCSGLYKTANETYSVYVLMKRNQDQYLIQTLHFRREFK
jgi:hypothetical protein